MSLILKKGAQANRRDLWDFQPLVEALEIGDIEIVQLLLSADVDVNGVSVTANMSIKIIFAYNISITYHPVSITFYYISSTEWQGRAGGN